MNKDVMPTTFGNKLMVLYGRINLSQGEFAHSVGISSVTLRKWESDASCPKAESLKRVIEILTSKGAFLRGEEQADARHLWALANQRGLKVPFDEVWFRAVMLDQAEAATGAAPVGTDRVGLSLSPSGPCPVPGVDPVPGIDLVLDAYLPGQTRGRSKGLLLILIALAILTIIGSAGTLFFQTRDHATTQAIEAASEQALKTAIFQYPGYLSRSDTLLSRSSTLAFFDPLSQQNGSKWGIFRGACRFTGGTYHIRKLAPAGLNRWCAPQGIFGNFAFEVQMTIVQGDCGGLTFRDDFKGEFYFFPVCQNSTYGICKYTNYNGCVSWDKHNTAIITGLGQQNKIAVVANGSTMTFYVNERQIDQLQDSSYTSGHIELNAALFYPFGHTTDVAYSNARLWTF